MIVQFHLLHDCIDFQPAENSSPDFLDWVSLAEEKSITPKENNFRKGKEKEEDILRKALGDREILPMLSQNNEEHNEETI